MARIRQRNETLIIQAASEVFAERGFAATKTLEIAERAGLPKANVYYYFKSKENLYRSVLESVIEPLLEASRPVLENDDPATALRAYIRAKLRISRDQPQASKVFASEIMHGAPHLPRDIAAQMLAQTRELGARLQGWIEAGRMAPVDPHHLLFTIWAATQTYADFDWQIAQVTGKAKLDDADFEAAAELIERLVLRGCEVAPPQADAQRAG